MYVKTAFFLAKNWKRAPRASTEGYLVVAASTPTSDKLVQPNPTPLFPAYFRLAAAELTHICTGNSFFQKNMLPTNVWRFQQGGGGEGRVGGETQPGGEQHWLLVQQWEEEEEGEAGGEEHQSGGGDGQLQGHHQHQLQFQVQRFFTNIFLITIINIIITRCEAYQATASEDQKADLFVSLADEGFQVFVNIIKI